MKTKAFAAWWERLRVPRKLWLHNGGHGGPARTSATSTRATAGSTTGCSASRNGILDEPRVKGAARRRHLRGEPDWPVPGTPDRAAAPRAPGTLATRARPRAPRQTFVDRGRELDTDDSLIQAPDAADPNRLAYLSPALRRAVHVSGTPEVTLRASVDNRNAANLTAVLVDYGPERRRP